MSNRLDQDKEKRESPKRMEYALSQLRELGFNPIEVNDNEIRFQFKGHSIKLFPYSGWHSGKSISDGRGIKNLLNQLK